METHLGRARTERRAWRSRWQWIVAVIVAGVLAGACGGGAPARGHDSQSTRGDSATPPAGAAHTVLIVGTSLTAGLGLDPAESYPALLQQKIDSAGLPFTVRNAGLSGETSAGALRRLDWLLRGPIDVFVLETGANDGLRGLDADSLRANIEAVIRRVKQARPAARICLVQMEAPPNLGPSYTRSFHDVYPEVARAEDVTLLPFLLDGVAGRPELNQADATHPNARGERIVAATVWRGLEPVLRSVAAGQKPGYVPPRAGDEKRDRSGSGSA
jgi:acyl-CoA thioesterase I